MERVYKIGWENKTKILNALSNDTPMPVAEINKIVAIDTAGLRKYLKTMALDGFVSEVKVTNPNRKDSKVNMYRAKNRDRWEEFVLQEAGHDLRPPEKRTPKLKKIIPDRNTPFWGLLTNGYL